jgi:hypothetical protein
MPCPRCHAEIAEDVEVCPHCRFTLSVLELQFPPPPPQTGHVNDWAGVLSATAAERITQRCQEVLARAQAGPPGATAGISHMFHIPPYSTSRIM